MRKLKHFILLILLVTAGSCITKFIPETSSDISNLVVEGLITDQPGTSTVKLSKTVPLDERYSKRPLRGCSVSILDDEGNVFRLEENQPGTYVTDSAEFLGIVGRRYQLNIVVYDQELSGTYESVPVEMKAVPPIDSLYFDKVTLKLRSDNLPQAQGCQIWLDTHDPESGCRYYRWTFTETWEILIPYPVENYRCWATENSGTIKIKTTTSIAEDRVSRYPLHFVSNETDRLDNRYSLEVRQYSLSEDEFDYWSRLKSISEETGSLYDITPATITGNMYKADDPYVQVLGFFSVSAVKSKRIFIEDDFAGLVNLYARCITDTAYTDSIPGLNSIIWLLLSNDYAVPPHKLLTTIKRCADCTTRGTNVEPVWWREDED